MGDRMFFAAKSFNKELKSWNVGNVRSMSAMFADAQAFNKELNEWEVGNVRDMEAMFLNAKAFDEPLDKWDVSKLENCEAMFHFSGLQQGNKEIIQNSWLDKLPDPSPCRH